MLINVFSVARVKSRQCVMLTKYLILFIFLLFYCNVVVCGKFEEIESHLDQGRQLESLSKYNDAFAHYQAAVELDSNYVTRFRRAIGYLALGNYTKALEDLNESLMKKPDFVDARLQRGSLLLKQGRLNESQIDLEWVVQFDPYDVDARHLHHSLELLSQRRQWVFSLMTDGLYAQVVDQLTSLLDDMPWDVELMKLRSEAFHKLVDIKQAIHNQLKSIKASGDNTYELLMVSQLYYANGNFGESLATGRRCLNLDRLHRRCNKHYKKVEKLTQQLQKLNGFVANKQYSECVAEAEHALTTENTVPQIVKMIKAKQCHCLGKRGMTEAILVCTEALEFDDEDFYVLCDRAEAHFNNGNFDLAYNDYQKAHNMNPGHQRALEGMKRAKLAEENHEATEKCLQNGKTYTMVEELFVVGLLFTLSYAPKKGPVRVSLPIVFSVISAYVSANNADSVIHDESKCNNMFWFEIAQLVANILQFFIIRALSITSIYFIRRHSEDIVNQVTKIN